jgi:hypothetical protein
MATKKIIRTGTQVDYAMHPGDAFPHSGKSCSDKVDIYAVTHTIGPVDRDQANVEAERGEVLVADMDQDGQLESFTITGKSHGKGGTPLAVPKGGFIFSNADELKLKGKILAQLGKKEDSKKGYTPSEIAKDLSLNDHKAILVNPNSDALSKQTAELMISRKQELLAKLAHLQEGMKGFPNGVPELVNEEDAIPIMALGGLITAYGGYYNMGGDPEKPVKRKVGTFVGFGGGSGGGGGASARNVMMAASEKRLKQIGAGKPYVFSGNPQAGDIANYPGVKKMIIDKPIEKNESSDWNFPALPSIEELKSIFRNYFQREEPVAVNSEFKGFEGGTGGGAGASGVIPKDPTLLTLPPDTVRDDEGLSIMDWVLRPTETDQVRPPVEKKPLVPATVKGPRPSLIVRQGRPSAAIDPGVKAAAAQKSAPETQNESSTASSQTVSSQVSPDDTAKWWLQDVLNNAGTLSNRLNITRVNPQLMDIEDPYIPAPTFFDNTRQVAAVQEAAAQQMDGAEGYVGAQRQRAVGASIQGQAAAQVANVIGQTANQNVGIDNQFSGMEAQAVQQTKAAKAEMRKRFLDESAIGEQQYRNAIAQANAQVLGQFNNGVTNAQKTFWLNKMNDSFSIDPMTGKIVFKKGKQVDTTKKSESEIDQQVAQMANAYSKLIASMSPETAASLVKSMFKGEDGGETRSRVNTNTKGELSGSVVHPGINDYLGSMIPFLPR